MKTFFASCFKSFTSRKFLVAVITAALLFFDKKLGLGLSLEEKAIAAGIGAFWILAETSLDFKGINKGINIDKVIERLQRVLPIVQEVMKRQNAAGLAFPDFGAMAQEIARGVASDEPMVAGAGETPLDLDVVLAAARASGMEVTDNRVQPSGTTTNIPEPTFAGKPDEEKPKAP